MHHWEDDDGTIHPNNDDYEDHDHLEQEAIEEEENREAYEEYVEEWQQDDDPDEFLEYSDWLDEHGDEVEHTR